jgi:hypothetical protein
MTEQGFIFFVNKKY